MSKQLIHWWVGVCLLVLTTISHAEDLTRQPPMVSAQGWAVARLGDGEVLHHRDLEVPRQIASLTKIMTALIVLDIAADEDAFLEQFVPVSRRAASTIGTSALLETGDRLTIRDLLYGLLLPSGNDAAMALAEQGGKRLRHLRGGGSEARFVRAMNDRAASLGLTGTRYHDVHGMGENVSTPAGLLVLSREVLANDLFREIVATTDHDPVVRSGGSVRELHWSNTNELLPAFSGVKTGHTNSAGGCLVLLGEYRGEEYLVVVLESANKHTRFADAYNLFQWAMLQQEIGELAVPAPD